jgi:hypothetical protein
MDNVVDSQRSTATEQTGYLTPALVQFAFYVINVTYNYC